MPRPADPAPPPDANALETALDQALEAILAGDLDQLGPIYARTEAILMDLRVTDALAADRIRAKAARNATCLAAAARGVRAARRRLQEIGLGAGHHTYDSTGRSQPMGGTGPGMDRRL